MTSSRYHSTDYQHRSSSFMGKHASYYEGTSHRTSSSGKPSSSSASLSTSFFRSKDAEPPSYSRSMSSSKYMDSSSTSSSSRRYEDMRSTKYPPRRIPPPLASTGGGSSSSFSSRTKPSNRTVPPLMKLSVDTSSKDYYGSRYLPPLPLYRQAPPEHHRDNVYPDSSSHGRNESKRSLISSSTLSRRPYTTSVSSHSGSRSYGKNLSAIRKATELTAASVTSRIRKRAAAARPSRERERERETKRHYKERSSVSAHRRRERSREKSIDSRELDEPRKRKRHAEKSDNVDSGDRGLEEDHEEQQMDEDQEPEGDENEDSKSSDERKGDEVQDGVRIKQEPVDTYDQPEDTGGEEEQVEETVAEKSPVDEPVKTKRERDKRSRERESSTTSSKKDSKNRVSDRKKSVGSHRNKRDSEDREEHVPHRALLKLKCHYCGVRCITFREFTSHLKSYQHTKAMNHAVAEMRTKVNHLRSQQRDLQRKLEKSSSEKTLSDTTSYCRVCELNFRTDPTEHEANELHNQIKGQIYQKCEVCNIEFRIWKVYLYHMAALEHAKRVALLELQAREGRGELVQGTNLSEQELGLHLVEERQVLYCTVCSRYIPIRETIDESKIQHCTTFTHVKAVDDHYAHEERMKEKKAREEKKQAAAKEHNQKAESGDSTKANNTEDSEATEDKDKNVDVPDENSATTDSVNENEQVEETTDRVQDNSHPDEDTNDIQNDGDEEDDEDEIELHADVDDDNEEEESEDQSTWSRRTRSSARKDTSKTGSSDMN